MAVEGEGLRDWHRLFGLLLTDFFSGSPFAIEVERDLSAQQQLLDVVIVRRRRGKLTEALPDGLGDLAEHNLITFRSLREALDDMGRPRGRKRGRESQRLYVFATPDPFPTTVRRYGHHLRSHEGNGVPLRDRKVVQNACHPGSRGRRGKLVGELHEPGVDFLDEKPGRLWHRLDNVQVVVVLPEAAAQAFPD